MRSTPTSYAAKRGRGEAPAATGDPSSSDDDATEPLRGAAGGIHLGHVGSAPAWARRRRGGGGGGGAGSPPPRPSPANAELSAAKSALVSSDNLVEYLERQLSEARGAAAQNAQRVREAERWVAIEAERAHNARQPFVLLPDVLQKKIINLLPSGR